MLNLLLELAISALKSGPAGGIGMIEFQVEGIMGIDATWKPGYPNPCVMPEEIVRKVDSRWSEYGFR